MEEQASRHSALILFASMLTGMGLGSVTLMPLFESFSAGVAPGALLGLAVGGLLTRQARARFVVPLLLLICGGIFLIVVLLLRAAGA